MRTLAKIEDEFNLPINFQGNALELLARFLKNGYTVKIEVAFKRIGWSLSRMRDGTGGGR